MLCSASQQKVIMLEIETNMEKKCTEQKILKSNNFEANNL